ncbi:MAG: hypothetical protein IPI67_40730 [Myxococcales bacterium]|nr:hypothetical protein [Myxococcales bacterium]
MLRASTTLVLFALTLGCENKKPIEFGPLASSSAKPVDRLAPGELAPGTDQVWGFVAPREMRLDKQFPTQAFFIGPVSAEALANYVRTRVEVERIEIGAARTVFPLARIKGGQADRTYRIEVLQVGTSSRLIINDVTPPPFEPGLSDEERWKRVGLTPDGRPIDPKKFE